MDKEAYYQQLHEELGLQYGVPSKYIKFIRCMKFTYNLSRIDIMDWIDEKVKRYIAKNNQPEPHLQSIFSFLEDLPEESWDLITKPTQYDKSFIRSRPKRELH